MALLACPGCRVTNRIPSLPKGLVRCGKCKRSFTPKELVKAKPESPPVGFALDQEDDSVENEILYACRKCGWEGTEEDCEVDEDADKLVCPDCGKRVKRVHKEDDDE